MGFKYTDRVYRFVTGTTPTEQLVLAVLAHIVNDKNGEGFPSITTIVKRSHLGRSTVMRSLDVLRDKGLLKWKPGGRTKNGRVLSNLYVLTLPKAQKERKKQSDVERWDDIDNSQDWVSERDGYPSQSETPHSPAAGPLPSQSGTPTYMETSIDHPDGHHPPPEASGATPGRFELGVARRNGTLDDVLEKMDAAARFSRRIKEEGPVKMAMEAAETNKVEDRKTFSLVMITKSPQDCVDEICRFESEKRQGEMSQIRNLPALLTKRLKALPDIE